MVWLLTVSSHVLLDFRHLLNHWRFIAQSDRLSRRYAATHVAGGLLGDMPWSISLQLLKPEKVAKPNPPRTGTPTFFFFSSSRSFLTSEFYLLILHNLRKHLARKMSCYVINSNVRRLLNGGFVPCSSTATSATTAQLCCASGDTCLSNDICYFTHPLRKGSGFYVGGCTQESFPGPACSTQCSE